MKRAHLSIALLAFGLLLAGLWATRGPSASAAEDASTVDVPRPSVLPQPALSYGARQGRALFQYYCDTCHGSEGRGDGFNAYNLDPRPRDLTAAEFQEQRSDRELATVIRSGGGIAGLSTAMPPWGHTLNERQIGYLIQYLRTLAAPPREPTTGS